MDLFTNDTAQTTVASALAPLAERLRPATLDDVVGQHHLTGPRAPIGRMVAAGRLQSMVLWGGPGTGKTSIARLLADLVGLRFRPVSAVTTNTAELKGIFAEARMHAEQGRGTCLFVDEIHRMTRSLQDQLLGPVEAGHITLIACTTEHVAYELVDAIRSRIMTLRLNTLTDGDLESILQRAEHLLEGPLPLRGDAREALISAAGGDARKLINQVDAIVSARPEQPLTQEDLDGYLGERVWRSDKDRDLHYDRISAFQKSMRGSDPSAALYWLAQMVEAGEDMDFILRRLIVTATEDVGMADPQALLVSVAARDAYRMLGPKEGEYVVAQAVVHVATAPKSIASYAAYAAAKALVRETGDVHPPELIINHPTPALAARRGYSKDHEHPGAFAGHDCWPASVGRHDLYVPTPRGFEAQISKRIEHWAERRAAIAEGDGHE